MRGNDFGAITLNQVELAQIAELRGMFAALSEKIEQFTDANREVALARTKLQEASMWANRAISVAQNPVKVVIPEIQEGEWRDGYVWRCPFCDMHAIGMSDMETHVHRCPENMFGCGNYYIVRPRDDR